MAKNQQRLVIRETLPNSLNLQNSDFYLNAHMGNALDGVFLKKSTNSVEYVLPGDNSSRTCPK